MNFQERVEKMMKDHPDKFKTEAAVWSYIRGCLRQAFWNKSLMKHRFKSSQNTPPPEGYTGRGKKGAVCALTGEWTMTSQLEVDHKDGHKALTDEEHIIPYIIHLLASGEDELQVVGKEAHRAKSYADKLGITFEQAAIEKKVIAKMKLPKPQQDKILAKYGLPCNNDTLRKQSWRTLIERGDV